MKTTEISMTDALFIIENANLQGGTEILTFNLMQALRRIGKDVYVFSVVPYTGSSDYVLSLSQDDYGKWQTCKEKIWNKLSFSIYSDRILNNILRLKFAEIKPSCIINQTYDIITAIPLNGKTVQVFNWSINGYEKSIYNLIAKKSIINRIIAYFCNWGLNLRRHYRINKFTYLITLTNASSIEIKAINKNIQDDKIIHIPNPITETDDCKNLSTLTNNNIIFVGRLSYEKGVMRLLHIWNIVSKKLPWLTLSIYGEGNAKIEMENYINKNKISRVIFKGFCDNLKEIYTHADICCITSDTEGFGMVITEAMYYGVPCISFDCPISPREIIADTGFIIPCFDEIAYAKAIINLFEEKESLLKLQSKCVKRARTYYMNNIIEQWSKIII